MVHGKEHLELLLKRETDSGQETTGTLYLKHPTYETELCKVLEDAWKNNQRNISCIPPGRYMVNLSHESPRFGSVPEVMDVHGRSHVLIHAGNTNADTHGCLLVGDRFGHLAGVRAVLNSRRTLRDLLERLAEEFPDGKCWLVIKTAPALRIKEPYR